jgi:MYXO-CTERM domain-containing protein
MSLHAYESATEQNDPIFTWSQYFPEYDSQTQQVVAASGQKVKAAIDGVVNFMSWLETNFPEQHAAVLQSRPELALPEFAMAGLAGLGQGETPAAEPTTDWGKQLTSILSPLLNVWQQRELVKVNIKRAEQGLSPLDTGAIAPTVNVGVSPEVRQAGIIGGLALLGVALLFLRRR